MSRSVKATARDDDETSEMGIAMDVEEYENDDDIESNDIRYNGREGIKIASDKDSVSAPLMTLSASESNVVSSSSPSSTSSSPEDVSLLLLMIGILSVTASSCVVLVNKKIFNLSTLNLQTVLLQLHLLASFLFAALAIEYIRRRYPEEDLSLRIPLSRCAINSLVSYSSIFYMNHLLSISSVSMYQFTKSLVIPAQALLQFFWMRIRLRPRAIFSIGLICLGVALLFASSDFSSKGGNSKAAYSPLYIFFVSCIAVFSVACDQVSAQQSFRAYKQESALPVLRTNSMFIFAYNFVFSLFGSSSLSDCYKFILSSFDTFGYVMLSGFFAFLVNFSSTFTSGKLSPIMYQIFGHAKTFVTIIGGLFFFDSISMTPLSWLSLLTIISGSALYSYLFVRREHQENSS